MLVTFTCNAYENIMYFGDVAQRLLTLMGHSGTVPGALKADEVAPALANLQHALEQHKFHAKTHTGVDDEQSVSLGNRAVPLINLLTAAVNKHCDVMWQ